LYFQQIDLFNVNEPKLLFHNKIIKIVWNFNDSSHNNIALINSISLMLTTGS